MSDRLDVSFAALNTDPEAVTVLLAGDDLEFGAKGKELDTKSAGAISKAAAAANYKGKFKATLEILAPAKLGIDRLIVAGLGKRATLTEVQLIELGGAILAAVQGRKCSTASIIVDLDAADEQGSETVAALIAQGAMLRHYNFKKYHTKKSADDADADKDGLKKITVHVAHHDRAKASFQPLKAIAHGVNVARDLVNEPANILGPVELAEKTKALEKLGVEVTILDVKDMEKLGMGSLLCVGQGSERPSRLAVMAWNGAKSKKAKPICFVGKGVIFDTGGISIKPAGGMEDMKGDMGGAAAVVGTMHALAERKANVNAVGLIGCVENMPSGKAVRPGDIVTSMSGQTIEVINTDAEGRLVLADVLWYAQEKFKPKLIVNLATLTGAIMIALGKEYAGMFANDDKLAEELSSASRATGEKVWRMPLDKAFDKAMDSRFADMKNTGGRWGGSCTAAAFLQRFIKDTPWCHLDVAGTAMDGAKNDFNTSWGSGWGVRLLNRFVSEFHEKG
jgi:leucyl aminopeptidase